MSDAVNAAEAVLSAQSDSSTESSESQENNNQQSEGQPETAQDAAAVLNDPNAPKAAKAEAKKMLKSLKIKFNGKEYDEELPFEIPDDPEAVKYMQGKLQMERLGRAKSQEAADQQKMINQFLSELKKNPRKVLSDPSIGVDLKRIAAELIEEEIENSKKSPEQLEKEKLEAELKAMKEEREKEKEEFNKRELERLQEQEFERYDMLITKAIESSDLPKSPYIIKKMADYMLMGLQKGVDVTPDDVLPLVREEMQNDLKEMFAVMPEDVIESIVGKDVINRIRKKNLQKARSGNVQAAQQVSSAKPKDAGITNKKEEKAADKKKMSDFFGF
jgi:hypothetical protein